MTDTNKRIFIVREHTFFLRFGDELPLDDPEAGYPDAGAFLEISFRLVRLYFSEPQTICELLWSRWDRENGF